MKNILVISRILSECRSVFNEDDIQVTLNEALVLEAVEGGSVTKTDIARRVFKDKAYVYRITESLLSKGLMEKEGNFHQLTPEGEEVCRRSKKICEEVVASHGGLSVSKG